MNKSFRNSKNGKLIPLDDIIKKLKPSDGKIVSKDDILTAIAELSELHGEISKYEELQRKKEVAKRKQEAEYAKIKAHEDHVKEVTSMELPLDFENAFLTDERIQGVTCDNSADALILSLTNLGRVDIEYMSAITGKEYKEVINDLKGSIYQNPERWEECFYKGWETADEYLSGNLMRKWQIAFDANKEYNHYFDDNVKAINEVLPPTVATKDIFVTLGSPWVPSDIIDDYIFSIFGKKMYVDKSESKVLHDEFTGTWNIPYKSAYLGKVQSYSVYGTPRMPALEIMERTLNMRPIVVADEVKCKSSKTGYKRVVNQAETIAAVDKQKRLVEDFQKWIWQDPDRKERLEIIFENNFSSYKRRRFDGSFLTFPGLSQNVTLYPYQKNAVARILFSPNTLLAHDVGSGKTYVMIAAGMEFRRMGLSKKNMYVIPNNILDQWEKTFRYMYPNANLLVVSPKHFTLAKQNDVLEKIRDNEYDGILIASSCFDRIALSKQYYIDKFEERKNELKKLASNKSKNTTGVKAEQKRIDKEIDKLLKEITYIGKITFDELGVSRLFVDEAHNYKNVPIVTKTQNVLGINANGSKKCEEMLDKVRFVQRANDGGGVIFATGTPITNSLTDAFVMQQYLQSGELSLLDLQSFDAWVGMFAERKTEFEIDVDTSEYRLATRFSKFHNLPELTALLSSIADFHQTKSSEELPNFDGYTDKLIPKTADFDKYLKSISKRVDEVRNGRIKRTEDNMLKITTDGRQAALDLRIVDKLANFTWNSKVANCAEVVADIHYKTRSLGLTQLVFCDSSTPKQGFNIYDELRRILVSMGVPNNEIEYVHDADTDAKRDKLFREMRQGKVRVLIGSTFKLGLGVNVQDKLVAVHHLDVPWRPADMVQREGRIIRPGNSNDKIFIYRYITEGSFDAYSWQLLETKQNFISALLDGSLEQRTGGDVSDVVLNYAEVKALAIGNPLIKERVETANELSRLRLLQVKYVEGREELMKRLSDLPKQIENQRKLVSDCRYDDEFYRENRVEIPIEDKKALRETIFNAVIQNEMAHEETTLLNYQGFDVILPINMLKEKPYVLLKRTGSYIVEVGNASIGVLTRIDNVLEGLYERYERLNAELENLESQQVNIRLELEKEEDFTERILLVKQKLEKLDKKLGVNYDD